MNTDAERTMLAADGEIHSGPGSLAQQGMDLDEPGSALRAQVLARTGEEMLSKAIALTLASPPRQRADLLDQLTQEIIAIVAKDPEMRPWTCAVHTGTDGSRIFRGGIGYSIVVDPGGRLWRAGTVEDFETTFSITPTTCEIESMKPDYSNMREYLPL